MSMKGVQDKKDKKDKKDKNGKGNPIKTVGLREVFFLHVPYM